ncbi:MAG: NAD(P)-dependent oxidoreductase [bacterium]
MKKEWNTYRPAGKRRVIVTKELPGKRWLEILALADCRVEVCASTDILTTEEIRDAMGARCDGCIGQLTERWAGELFDTLVAAGGKAYSNYAVGFDNVDLLSATRCGIPVGNTPGVLTETTAEMAVSLTFAAARRVAEGDRFMRAGRYRGWLPTLLLGQLLWRKTVGIIGAGRIGAAYGRMMVEGHKMHLLYYDLHPNPSLEAFVADYGRFLESRGESPVSCRRAETLEEVLREADVVSLHTVLSDATRHLINQERLSRMQENAVLVNTSRGPLIDEEALVAHCRRHPNFRAGLDVFEDEPAMKPGLKELDNVVIVPHLGSASTWTRESMAVLAAANVAGMLLGYPLWAEQDLSAFLRDPPPKAVPSVVNARELQLPLFRGSR